MANYATLKSAIQQAIKENHNNEITGNLLQQSLLAMINSLGVGYQYMGIATPTTNPGTPDQNVFYLASTAGTYTNFGGLSLADGEISILKYNGAWSKDSTNAASLEKVNQLQHEVDDIYPDLTEVYEFVPTWVDNKLLRSNGAITDISSGGHYNACATTDPIPCDSYAGKQLRFSHGSTGTIMLAFYKGTATIIGSVYTYVTTAGTDVITIPSDAVYFRMGVDDANHTGTLPGMKSSTIATTVTTVIPSIQESIAELNEEVDAIATKTNEMYSDLYAQVVFPKTWTDNKLLRNNGAITDIDSSNPGYYNKCSTTDKISCVDYIGKTINLAYGYASGDSTYLAFYNVNDKLVGTNYNSYSGIGVASVEIPANASYFRLGVVSANTSGLENTKDSVVASLTVMKELSSSGGDGKTFSAQRIGAMKYALPTDFDLPQLLFFGQSFAQGGSSKVVDTEVIPNCLMFGNTVKAITGNAFNPLQLKTDTTEPYEFPVVSCANALCNMYRRFGHDIQIVASTAGASGTSIHTLIESYLINVTNMHTNMYATAQALNKSVGCFAIVFMQGESDYGGREDSTPDKDAYKAYLMQVKNALQQSAMNNLHQTRKPLFFIYQTSGGWVRNYEGIDNEALGVSMAQLEFAAENDDVILISPAYQVTTYTDSHPSSNGYRWLGEYYAKAIWQTLYRGFRYKNPRIMDYKVEAKKISLYVSDCVLPLMKNTWTLPQKDSYGFAVKADNVAVAIERVELVDNAIVLNLATDINSATSVKISYGGIGVGGKGNICDSDTWGTWWQYLSDANDDGYDGNRVIGQSPTAEGGGSLVGEDYPMNNFLCLFYKEITQ